MRAVTEAGAGAASAAAWMADPDSSAASGTPAAACAQVVGGGSRTKPAADSSVWCRPAWRTGTAEGSAAIAVLEQLQGALIQGFEIAQRAGPLCGEPVWGVCVSVHDVILHGDGWARRLQPGLGEDGACGGAASLGSGLQGYVLGCARVGVMLGLQCGQGRVVEALYACELHCSAGLGGGGEFLGRLHGVVARRRGEVKSEEIIAGTETFVVKAELPVAESFGFATEVRDRTSGLATSPQMVLARWQVLTQDPYFVPRTAAEREEHGDRLHSGQARNVAREMVDATRRRKGLRVEEQLV